MDGLICLQRETVRFAEEWARAREPGAEGRGALVAIETLRTLALRTMAELGAREEPVPTEDLGRLALALHRIESADRLRIEREQAAADAPAAHAGPAARAASMTHAERVETVRRAHGGARLPWVHRPAAAGIRMGRRLCRGLSRHPAEAGARSACRPAPDPLPRPRMRKTPPDARMRPTPAGRQDAQDAAGRAGCMRTRAVRAIHGTRTGRGMPS